MDESHIDRIISALVDMRARIPSFIGEQDDVEAARHFLDGFSLGCRSLGYICTFDDRSNALGRHSLRGRADGIAHEMRAGGSSEADIVRMMFDVEMDKWRACRDRIASTNTSLEMSSG
jgi:hypothetical protein